MGNIVANLKGMNYKQLAIDHGEKIVMGFFALVAVLILFGTPWSTYKREPAELSTAAEKAREEALKSTWPEDQRLKYENMPDIREEVRELVLEPIDVSRWEYTTDMIFKLHRKQEPIEEPQWLAVEDLIATSGHVLVALQPDEADMPGGGLAAGELGPGAGPGGVPGSNDPDFDARFAARTGSGGGVGAGPGGQPGAMAFDPAMMAPGDPAMAGMMDPAMDQYMPYACDMGAGNIIGGEGQRCVWVRGVFPLRKQLEAIVKSLHQAAPLQAAELIEFLDFELQRQKAVAGDDPWASEWEPVDIQAALTLLSEVDDFEPDVVDTVITDSVFTMPLPRRIVGYWTTEATHPRVKNFELSREEMERELRINEKVIQAHLEMQRRNPRSRRQTTMEKGGFSQQQFNTREIRYEVMASEQGTNVLDELRREFDPENLRRQLSEELKERVTAHGRLLLFRFLDFDVHPGNAYRSLGRLVLRNPNFLRRLEEVVDQSVIEGEIRYTPWSDPSTPSIVKNDEKYFLTSVQQPRGRTNETANFEIFEWDQKLGTTKVAEMRMQFGQFLGGTAKTEILDPAKQKFEEQNEVEFSTELVLLDAMAAPVLDPENHKELKLSARQRATVGVVDRALVVNEFGELVPVEPVTHKKEREDAQKLVERERRPFEFLKQMAAAATVGPGGGLDALLMEEQMMMEADAMGGRRQRGRRRRSPTRITDPSMMMAPEMMPGMAPGMAPGGRRP